jgi:hypothetical protein
MIKPVTVVTIWNVNRYIYMYIYVCVSNVLCVNMHNIIINIIYYIRNINIFLSIFIIKLVIIVRLWNVIIYIYICVWVCVCVCVCVSN